MSKTKKLILLTMQEGLSGIYYLQTPVLFNHKQNKYIGLLGSNHIVVIIWSMIKGIILQYCAYTGGKTIPM